MILRWIAWVARARRLGLVFPLAALALAALVLAPAARAQSSNDKAEAEALFQAGRDLLKAGKYPEACANFEASQALDAGLGTLLYLADCYEKAGRLASAWANFKEAESIATGRADTERATIARQRYTALEPRLSKLWIQVADGNDPAIEVTRNGEKVPRESWGIAIPVDPGNQSIEASAPGRKKWQHTVTVSGEAQNVSVQVPVLAASEAAPPAPAPPAPAATPPPSAPAPSPLADQGRTGSPGSTQRVVSYVVGGVGIVGLAVGAVFGLRAKSKKDQSLANGHCPNDPNVCDQTGFDLRNQARDAATISTVSMIVGGAALAGGIVLFLTAPKKSAHADRDALHVATETSGPGSARISLGGAF